MGSLQSPTERFETTCEMSLGRGDGNPQDFADLAKAQFFDQLQRQHRQLFLWKRIDGITNAPELVIVLNGVGWPGFAGRITLGLALPLRAAKVSQRDVDRGTI